MGLKSYTLVSNRGPNFISNKTPHLSAGGTQDIYRLLCEKLAKRWICITSTNYDSNQVISKHDELDVLCIDNYTYSKYYYEFVSEYLYPNILGSFGVASSASAIKEFNIVSQSVARKIEDDDRIILCDYHLYKVPKFLKSGKEVHFFWFLPFLDNCNENSIYLDILNGLINVNTLWFLHEDYKNNFLKLAKQHFEASELPEIRTLTLGPNIFYKHTESINIDQFKFLIREEFNIAYDRDCTYMLTVARLDFVKKIPLLVEAISMIEKKLVKTKLIILAPHHRQESSFYQMEEAKIYKLLDKLLHKKDIIYISHNKLGRNKLRVLYKFTDLFILPSTYDAMPLTPMEYTLSNKGDGGVVVSNSAGTAKIFSNSSYIFENDNPNSLSQTILTALNASRFKKEQDMKTNKLIISEVTSDKWISKVSAELCQKYDLFK